MFTGIITDIGTVLKTRQDGALQLRIGTRWDVRTLDIGASVACDGLCLTVVATGGGESGWFEVEASGETVARSTMRREAWGEGRQVNLERALKVGDELGGHIVQGHVDGVAEVLELRAEGSSTRVRLRAPEALSRYIAPKGSVALNGTSLTVNEVEGRDFGVNLIPHTLKATTWGGIRPGDAVNLEVDTLARYVARIADTAG